MYNGDIEQFVRYVLSSLWTLTSFANDSWILKTSRVRSHVPVFYKHCLISIMIMMFHRNDAKRAGMQ